MPSFDIVSKTDMEEVRNAISGVQREITQRFDFKGSNSEISESEGNITILADDSLKLDQMHELLKVHLTRRKVEAGALSFSNPEKASGNMLRQSVEIKQGIEKDLAKKLVKSIKDTKIKVQVSIQGDSLRVTGKKRDELQQVISHVKSMENELPLQYENFRD